MCILSQKKRFLKNWKHSLKKLGQIEVVAPKKFKELIFKGRTRTWNCFLLVNWVGYTQSNQCYSSFLDLFWGCFLFLILEICWNNFKQIKLNLDLSKPLSKLNILLSFNTVSRFSFFYSARSTQIDLSRLFYHGIFITT